MQTACRNGIQCKKGSEWVKMATKKADRFRKSALEICRVIATKL
jgi:hypothetical protein